MFLDSSEDIVDGLGLLDEIPTVFPDRMSAITSRAVV
jgi:hypothetical protein